MKTSLIQIILIAFSVFPTLSETIVVSELATNSIVVSSNEAIIIDFVDPDTRIPILRQGTSSLAINVRPGSALMGPCELVYGPFSAAVTFRRLKATSLKTIVLASNQTEIVVVPPNKTLRLFPIGLTGSVLVSRDANERWLSANSVTRGCEFTGPLIVTFTGQSQQIVGHELRQVFTYCLIDEFIQLTPDGYITGPVGSFEIVVEKSTDLNHWIPAMIQSTAQSDSTAYFRLRLQK